MKVRAPPELAVNNWQDAVLNPKAYTSYLNPQPHTQGVSNRDTVSRHAKAFFKAPSRPFKCASLPHYLLLTCCSFLMRCPCLVFKCSPSPCRCKCPICLLHALISLQRCLLAPQCCLSALDTYLLLRCPYFLCDALSGACLLPICLFLFSPLDPPTYPLRT